MFKKLLSLILFFCATAVALAAEKPFTLVIDAGHGGNDAGALGAISKEKNINLSVALAFGRLVEQNCPDVKVIYTRKKDVFVTLQGRADIANKAKADLFISIHTNAVAGSKSVRGFEVYTLGMHRASDNLDVAKRENSVITLESDYASRYQGFDPNSSESYIMFEYMQDKNMENSVKLARNIQSSVCSTASLANKGVHQAGFLVLRETSMPSCLIELGFISTPAEERQLNDPVVQSQIATGIFKAFQKYRGKNSSIAVPEPIKPVENSTRETEPVKESQQPAKVAEPAKEQKVAGNDSKADNKEKAVDNTDKPVFKVQIFVADRVLKPGDKILKGLTDADYYKEKGVLKYTYGASTNYNEIYSLRKQILDKFPECFIVAFKNGEKVNVNEAIKEWKANR